MSQTKFYAVVYNDGELAGPVLARGGAGVIVIDTSKAK